VQTGGLLEDLAFGEIALARRPNSGNNTSVMAVDIAEMNSAP
jgi:hypothetical protein